MITFLLYQLRLFFIALQFFTRIPIPQWVGFEVQWLQHSVRYFPLVGLVVGVVSALSYYLAAQVWSQGVAVVLSTICSIYLTGAFHEDGFADLCDGFGGGLSKERVLEIMVDSRVGAYGALGLVLMLGLKCTVLAQFPPELVVPVLLLTHPLSRLAPSALIWRLQYVKGEGKAKPLAQQMSHTEFAVAVLTVVGVTLALASLLPAHALALAWLAAALACVAMGHKMWRRIGGYTGDCLGATQQVAEVAIYLALLAVLGRAALN